MTRKEKGAPVARRPKTQGETNKGSVEKIPPGRKVNSTRTMAAKAKLKALKADDWVDIGALAKRLASVFMANTPPERQSTQPPSEFWAEFEGVLKEELALADAADAAAKASPIRRAEKKRRIRSERAGKIRVAPKSQV